jgi:phosphoglycerate dehydrogenase-like enzyme
MIEVLVTFPLEESFATRLRGVSPKFNVTISPINKAEEISAAQWEKTEILFTETVLPDPDKAKKLKWIQFNYSGLDQWIGNPLISSPGIQVTSLSGATVSQIAEHAIMMMLILGHKIPGAIGNQRKSEWPIDKLDKYQPLELRGSTVGIVGYGSIGRQIARLLTPFGATILTTKRDAKSPEDFGFTLEGMGDPDGSLAHRIYPAEALKSMLKLSDFVVVCVPLTHQTIGLLNGSSMAAIKPGAFLIDISRGRIVEHSSLIKALQEEKLAGAALDVFPEEPLPPDNPLWGMNNVIITPHIADNSRNYGHQASHLFSENLHRYLAGLPLFNLFNADRGY